MTGQVTVTLDGAVAVVEFSAPRRANALSLALLGELRECLAGPDVAGSAAVVLTGAGGVFSAGADLNEITGTEADQAIDEHVSAVIRDLRNLPAPVIAAVEGPCVGAGVDVMLACDLAVASAAAFFEVPAMRLGLLYNPAAIRRWQQVLPRSALRRLLLLGERFDAPAALEAELVDRVVPAGTAVARSVGLAGRAVAGEAANATKRLLTSLEDGAFDPAAWEAERRRLLRSADRWQAVAAAKTAARITGGTSDDQGERGERS